MHDTLVYITARDVARIRRQLASHLAIQGRIHMESSAELGYTVGHSQRRDSRPRTSLMDRELRFRFDTMVPQHSVGKEPYGIRIQ